MNSIIALEELIKKNEERINLQRRQLADHESGVNKLSRVMKASTETNLEEAMELLAKYKSMLEELMKQDIKELEEKERLEAAIKRKKYFENQKIRIKNNKEKSNDQKLEAMMIIDELPSDINFEDEELFEIASKAIELNIRTHKELHKKLAEIRKKFQDLLKDAKDEKINDLGMLNYQIPILVLHCFVLLSNIKENKEEENKEEELRKFSGFPKYEDWWINELWSSHQAYLALYKWKSIITALCITSEQKRSWSVIFNNWIFIKKMLNSKGELAFEYNYAFDSLMMTYADIEEELSNKNLLAMESIVNKIIKKEDFITVKKSHNIMTPYLKFKIAKTKDSEN